MIKKNEQFVVDDNGKKKAVIIPLRQYEEMMEGLHDLAVIAERKNEKSIPFEEVVRQLKKDGRL